MDGEIIYKTMVSLEICQSVFDMIKKEEINFKGEMLDEYRKEIKRT